MPLLKLKNASLEDFLIWSNKEPSLFLPMSQTLKMSDAHFQAENVPVVSIDLNIILYM